MSCRWRSLLDLLTSMGNCKNISHSCLFPYLPSINLIPEKTTKKISSSGFCPVDGVLCWTGQLLLLSLFLSAASTNEGPCASFSNSARMPLIFLMGIYVKNKIYEPQRTRRRRKNKDLGTAAGAAAVRHIMG